MSLVCQDGEILLSLFQVKEIKTNYIIKRMTTSMITKATEMDYKKFKLSNTVKVNKYQGKSVYASYNNSIMRIQLPKMGLPFGISKFTNPDNGDVKYSLDMSMKDIDESVFKNFEEIENAVLDYAEKNSKELFKKQRSKEILKEFYKPFIKYALNEEGERSDKYPPTFKTKLWTSGLDFSADVFDAQKVDGKYPKIKMTLDNSDEVITAGSHCETIIQFTGLWVVGDSFGISWSVSQIKIYKNSNAIVGYAFQDEDVEMDDEEQETEEVEEFHEEELQELEEPEIKIEEPVVVQKKRRRPKDEL